MSSYQEPKWRYDVVQPLRVVVKMVVAATVATTEDKRIW
jgi:hypothetical protein